LPWLPWFPDTLLFDALRTAKLIDPDVPLVSRERTPC